MPPKPKFTKDEIVDAALDIVSRDGVEAMTAREVGERLGSSARPIFTVFGSMEELYGEVRKAAMRRFESYSEKAADVQPVFKRVGMQMALFGEHGTTADMCIDAICSDYGLDREAAKKLFENVWIYTFGVGALCASKMCRFSKERLSRMLTTEFKAMMMLVKSGGID